MARKKKQTIGEKIARTILPNTFEDIDKVVSVNRKISKEIETKDSEISKLNKVNTKLSEINERAVSMLGTSFTHDKYPLPMTWFFNPGFGIPVRDPGWR